MISDNLWFVGMWILTPPALGVGRPPVPLLQLLIISYKFLSDSLLILEDNNASNNH